MSLSTIELNYASITPLDRPEVLNALLNRTPKHVDDILDTYATVTQTIAQMREGTGQLFKDAGLPESFIAAVLIPRFGSQVPVRIWCDLSEDDIELIKFFNFDPGWQGLDQVSHLLQKNRHLYVDTHSLHMRFPDRQAKDRRLWANKQYGGRYTEVSPIPLDTTPLMGLDYMIEQATLARDYYNSLKAEVTE